MPKPITENKDDIVFANSSILLEINLPINIPINIEANVNKNTSHHAKGPPIINMIGANQEPKAAGNVNSINRAFMFGVY
nr:hypothetical protein [uncultured Tolumonas sp.]